MPEAAPCPQEGCRDRPPQRSGCHLPSGPRGIAPAPPPPRSGERGRQSRRSPPSAAAAPPSERNHIRKVFGVFLAAFNAISQLAAGGASPHRPDHREGPARRCPSGASRGRPRAAGGRCCGHVGGRGAGAGGAGEAARERGEGAGERRGLRGCWSH